MELKDKKLSELKNIAKSLNITGVSNFKKAELIEKIQSELLKDTDETYSFSNKDIKIAESKFENENESKITKEDFSIFRKALDKVNKKNAQENERKINELKEQTINYLREDDLTSVIDKKLKEIDEKAEKEEIEKIKKQQDMEEILLSNGKTIKLNTKTDKIIDGYVQILKQGYGFIRDNIDLISTENDVYLAGHLIDQFSIRNNDKIKAIVRQSDDNKYPGVIYVVSINESDPLDKEDNLTGGLDDNFNKLTPVYPYKRLVLENNPKEISGRMIDLVSPIGLGQRAIIVSPPKAGKTTLLKHIARSIKANDFFNDISLIMLLIDERPEEVTDIKRTIDGKVYYSTFDMSPLDHIQIAEKTIEEAKKMVIDGKNVVILLDSITRLARAYNIVEPSSGKILSGGFDPIALYKPKQFFGSARQTEEAGSLTIIATALVDTGSKMDDFIFEEFKGTGNMEIVLDRSLAESRIFPAINLKKSGTRKEELLVTGEELIFMEYIRSSFSNKTDFDASRDFINILKNYNKNDVMVNEILKEIKRVKKEKE